MTKKEHIQGTLDIFHCISHIEYSCHGEVQQVYSVSTSDIKALRASGATGGGGGGDNFTLTEGPQYHYAFYFNLT